MTTDNILNSWNVNSQSWITTIDDALIASRQIATNTAITTAVAEEKTGLIIDVGCGEGWLSRHLAQAGWGVSGIDGVSDLVENAKQKGGGPKYYCYNYHQLRESVPNDIEQHDGIVINFALFEDEKTLQLLSALRSLVHTNGFMLIQTVALPPGEETGWRTENWQGMATDYKAAMPWYYRDDNTWEKELGVLPEWQLTYLRPVKHPKLGDTLSWIIKLKAI